MLNSITDLMMYVRVYIPLLDNKFRLLLLKVVETGNNKGKKDGGDMGKPD